MINGLSSSLAVLKENQEALSSQLNEPVTSAEPPVYAPEDSDFDSDDYEDDENLYESDDYEEDEAEEDADDDDFDYDDID